MSEKIILRNKLVSKLENKMSELTKSIHLLTKIDKKLFLKQSGGGFQQMDLHLANISAKADLIQQIFQGHGQLKIQYSELQRQVDEYTRMLENLSNKLQPPLMQNVQEEFKSLSHDLMQDIINFLSIPYKLDPADLQKDTKINEAFNNIRIKMNKEVLNTDEAQELLQKLNTMLNESIEYSEQVIKSRELLRSTSSSSIGSQLKKSASEDEIQWSQNLEPRLKQLQERDSQQARARAQAQAQEDENFRRARAQEDENFPRAQEEQFRQAQAQEDENIRRAQEEQFRQAQALQEQEQNEYQINQALIALGNLKDIQTSERTKQQKTQITTLEKLLQEINVIKENIIKIQSKKVIDPLDGSELNKQKKLLKAKVNNLTENLNAQST